MIHAGHEDLFRQARSLAEDPFLIVSVARDSAALRHRKASPRNDETVRLTLIKEHPLVDRAILGDEAGFIEHIAREVPDIIALGYDQEGEYVDTLKEELARAGLFPRIVRLNPFQPETFKTSRLLGK